MENRVDNHSYEMHSREQRPSDSNNSPRAPPQSSMPPKLSPSFNPNRISASSGGSSDKDAKELLESIPQSPNSNVHSGYEYQHDYQGRENASYPQNNDNYYQYGQPYPAQYDGQYPPEAKGYEHGQGYDYGYDQYNQQYNQQYPEYGYQQGYNYGQPEYEQSHPSYAPNSAYTASYANQPYPQEDYAHTISNYESSYQHSIHSHDPSEYGRNVKFDKDAKSEKNYSSPLKTNRMSAMSTGSVIHERYCCGMFKSKRKCALVCVPIWTILLAIIGSQLVILGVAVFFLFPRNPTFTIGQVQEVDPLAVNDVATLRTGNPPFQANFSMETDIVVTSSNYIAWSINQLTIKAFIRIPFIDPKTNKLGYTIAPVEVASGSRSAITLRAQGNTTIPIKFYIYYQASGQVTPTNLGNSTSNLGLYMIIQSCGANLFPYGSLPIDNNIIDLIFESTVTLGIFKFDLPQNIQRIPCPQGALDLVKIVHEGIFGN